MTSPVVRVSVIVPNYNHARFLPDRLRSIFGQTFRDVEVIFLDDASTDGSVAIAEAEACPFPYTAILNQERCGSPVVQWSRGVARARGEFIWIAESDDVSDPRVSR